MPKKVHIDEVFNVMQKFNATMTRVNRDHWREPGEWNRQRRQAQDEVREKFDAWGLSDLVDWSDPEHDAR